METSSFFERMMMEDMEILDQMLDEDYEMAEAVLLLCDETVYRSSPLYRKRWDCNYLVNLAVAEGSFLAEYRLGPREFDTLHSILHDAIAVDQRMAAVAVGSCGSKSISTASRLGIV